MSSNLEVICQHIQWHQIGTELLPVQTHVEKRELLTVASGCGNNFYPVKCGLMVHHYYARHVQRRQFPCHKCGRNFFQQQIAWWDETRDMFMCTTCHSKALWGVTWNM